MGEDEDFDDESLQTGRPGHTIGEPSLMRGMSRNSRTLEHTNSIASRPNVPVSHRLDL